MDTVNLGVWCLDFEEALETSQLYGGAVGQRPGHGDESEAKSSHRLAPCCSASGRLACWNGGTMVERVAYDFLAGNEKSGNTVLHYCPTTPLFHGWGNK